MEHQYNSRREILATTILRLHPSTQPIKIRVIEKVISQLFLSKKILSLNLIQKNFRNKYGIHFSIPEIKNSIDSSSNIECIGSDQYKLSEKFENELKFNQKEITMRYKRIIKSIFGNHADIDIYLQPFVYFLSKIFSKMSEDFVRQLKEETGDIDFINKNYYYLKLNETIKNYRNIDKDVFKHGINKFFSYRDPDYDYVKWVMAQNYYLLKGLGLDPTGYILSEDKFRKGTFYVDTNILVAIVFNKHYNHISAEYVLSSIEKLEGKTKIAHITVEEFKSWLNYQLCLLEKTEDRIPKILEEKVKNLVYSEFKYFLKESNYSEDNITNFDEFNKFILKKFEETINRFEIVDNVWFDEQKDKKETKILSNILKKKHSEISENNKSNSAAIHDAILLRWIDMERKEIDKEKLWIITLDHSLPYSLHEKGKSLSITLDSFFQWISPFIDIPSVEQAFSDLIRNRFFPQGKVLDLKDFLVFYELDIKSKDLPSEDIEESIVYFKNIFDEPDFNNPKSLMKISYNMARFFADPSRKYLQEIKKAHEEKDKMKQEYDEKLGKLNGDIRTLNNQYQSKLKEKDRELLEFKQILKKEEEEKYFNKLKDSAKKRLLIVIVLVLIVEVIILFLIMKCGIGYNIFQKITNNWVWLSSGIPILLILGWFIIGKERLRALGWPFNKIFKIE